MRLSSRVRNICVAMPHTDLNHAVASIDPPAVNWLDNRRHALLALPARWHVVGNVYHGRNRLLYWEDVDQRQAIMSQQPDDLKSLEKRLSALKAEVSPAEAQRTPLKQGFTMMNVGMTIVFSLVGGIFVGALIGLGLDRLLGTSPWLLIVMLLFGSAAGITTAVRMSNELAAQQTEVADTKPVSGWDDEDEDD